MLVSGVCFAIFLSSLKKFGLGKSMILLSVRSHSVSVFVHVRGNFEWCRIRFCSVGLHPLRIVCVSVFMSVIDIFWTGSCRQNSFMIHWSGMLCSLSNWMIFLAVFANVLVSVILSWCDSLWAFRPYDIIWRMMEFIMCIAEVMMKFGFASPLLNMIVRAVFARAILYVVPVVRGNFDCVNILYRLYR